MGTTLRRRRLAVIGAALATETELDLARRVGAEIARSDAILLCGGLGGVMEAAAHGASAAGGLTLGFLPDYDPESANAWIAIPLPTGLGQARNVLVVAGAEAVIAIGGGAGTLSEIGMALKLGRPVVGLGTWKAGRADGETAAILEASEPAAAVRLALAQVRPTS